MKELVRYIATSLVDDQEAVEIEEKEVDENTLLLSLKVQQADVGKIIGKKGRTARAIRTLLSVGGAAQNKKIKLDIIEPDQISRQDK